MNVFLDEATRQEQSILAEAQRVSPRVSIIVTNFNYGRYLRVCIESALGQDFPGVEVIAVDDGSTDDSAEILAALKTEYPALTIIFQANGGQAAAMNTGCRAARGAWLLFLDADDFLDPNAIRTTIEAAQDGDATLQFYLRTVDDAGLPIGLHPFCHVIERGNLFPQLCASGHFRFMPTSGNLLRRAHLDAILPIPEREWRICADTYVILAIATQGSVRTVPETLGSYRVHDSNAWYEEVQGDAKQKQIIRNHLTIWSHLLDLRAVWPRSCDDYAVLSLIRRIAISLYLYRDHKALTARELAGLQRKLRHQILRANVPLAEKLLHLLLLYAAKSRKQSLFKRLLAPIVTNGRKDWMRFLRAPERLDWISRTEHPPVIAELPMGRAIDFGHGGKGRYFTHYGFGEAENWVSWSAAERAGLIFRVPGDVGEISLRFDVVPYLCAPEVTSQRVEILCNGKNLYSGQLTAAAELTIRLTKEAIGADGVVALEFRLPDAVVPALVNPKSMATRLTALALKSMTARQDDAKPAPKRYPPIRLGKLVAAGDLLVEPAPEGWDYLGKQLRLYRRTACLRFSVPNPVMERFVVRVEFQRVPRQTLGDCRVEVELAGVGRDIIDLRETGSALIVVPRGKAPISGLFDLIFRAFDIFPWPGEDEALPGPRLNSLALQQFDLGPSNMSLWRSHQIVDFAAAGEGGKYLVNGWHAPDARGAWSADTWARLAGLYFEEPGEVFLTFRLGAWSGNALPRQHIRILANSTVIIERDLDGTEDLLAVLPADLIGTNRYLKIDIECRFVLSMRRLGEEDSPRNVGICLEKLVIEPLAGYAVPTPSISARS